MTQTECIDQSLKTKQSKNDINSPSSGEGSSNVALISKESDSELLCEEQSSYLPEDDFSVFNVDKDGNLSTDLFQDVRVCVFPKNNHGMHWTKISHTEKLGGLVAESFKCPKPTRYQPYLEP